MFDEKEWLIPVRKHLWHGLFQITTGRRSSHFMVSLLTAAKNTTSLFTSLQMPMKLY